MVSNVSAKRRAMTLVEITAALAIVGVLGVIVAQCIVWSLHERTQLAAHQAALELAANTLESARAQAWDKLGQGWADSLTVPAEMADLLPEGKLVATVKAGQPGPHTRQVAVEVSWQFESHLPPQSVRLTTFLSERSTKKAGGPP